MSTPETPEKKFYVLIGSLPNSFAASLGIFFIQRPGSFSRGYGDVHVGVPECPERGKRLCPTYPCILWRMFYVPCAVVCMRQPGACTTVIVSGMPAGAARGGGGGGLIEVAGSKNAAFQHSKCRPEALYVQGHYMNSWFISISSTCSWLHTLLGCTQAALCLPLVPR